MTDDRKTERPAKAAATQPPLGSVRVRRLRPAKMLTLSPEAWARLQELADAHGTKISNEVERLVRLTM